MGLAIVTLPAGSFKNVCECVWASMQWTLLKFQVIPVFIFIYFYVKFFLIIRSILFYNQICLSSFDNLLAVAFYLNLLVSSWYCKYASNFPPHVKYRAFFFFPSAKKKEKYSDSLMSPFGFYPPARLMMSSPPKKEITKNKLMQLQGCVYSCVLYVYLFTGHNDPVVM